MRQFRALGGVAESLERVFSDKLLHEKPHVREGIVVLKK